MLKKITATNFLSWEKLEYDVQPGVSSIYGWNFEELCAEGIGKTAIIDAIGWGGYGKIPRNVGIDDVVRYGQKRCMVRLDFNDGFSVIRSRKKNDLYYIYDGEEHRGSSMPETQKEITRILGISFEGFCHTVYQSQAAQSLFIKARPEEKMNILTEIVDLGIFDRAKKDAHERLKGSTQERENLQHAFDLTQSDLRLVKSQIEQEGILEKNALLQKEAALRAQTAVIASHQMRIDTASVDFNRKAQDDVKRAVELAQELKTLQQRTQNSETKSAGLQEQGKTLAAKLVPAEKKQKLEAKLVELKVELEGISSRSASRARQTVEGKRFAVAYKQHQDELRIVQDFIDNPSKNCPTCGTLLDDCDTQTAQEEKVKLENLLASDLEAMQQISAELKALGPPTDSEAVEEQIQRLNQGLVSIELLHTEYLAHQQDIRAAEVLVEANQDGEKRLQAKIKSEEEVECESLESRLKPLQAQLEAEQEKMKDLENIPSGWTRENLDALCVKQQEFIKVSSEGQKLVLGLNTKITSLEELKSGFREVKAYVFEGFLAELNTRANKYLERLFEIAMEIEFKRTGKDIETLITANDIATKVGLLSGGQHKRVSLSVDLALNDLIAERKSSRFSIIILDEYFKDLSEESMRKCLVLLEERDQPVILIEHNSIFQSIVTQTFKISFREGVSYAA